MPLTVYPRVEVAPAMAESDSISKVCEFCGNAFIPDTKRPHRIARQRFCTRSCASRSQSANRPIIELPPLKKRGKRKAIPLGLFEEEAKRLARVRKHSRESYWRNREKNLARDRSDKKRAQRRAWYAANKEKAQAASNKWRRKNIERIRANDRLRTRDAEKRKRYMLQWMYGVTWEWYQATLAAQENKCATCRIEFSDERSRRPRVDHHHGTGAVRGILCSNCNSGIGMFKESKAAMLAAVDYLERHGG